MFNFNLGFSLSKNQRLGLPSGGPLLTDTFTDSDETLLSAHTPDFILSGDSWHDAAAQYKITGNSLVKNGATGNDSQSYIDVGRLAKKITFSIYVDNPASYNGRLNFRKNGAAIDHLALDLHSNDGGLVRLSENDSSMLVSNSSWSIGLGWFNVEIVDTGSNVKISVDGVQYVDHNTTSNNGYYGIGFRHWSGCSPKWDNLVVTF